MSTNKERSKLSSSCLKILKQFDYFGAEMKFLINNDDRYRTKLGGGIFFFYFLISLAYVGFNFYQFATRQVQTLSFSSKVISPTPSIYLNSTSFRFSLGLLFNDNYSSAVEQTSKYLDIVFEHWTYNIDIGDYMSRRTPFAFCNRSDFKSIEDNIFYLNNLNSTLCPLYEQVMSEIVLQGDYTDQTQSFLTVSAIIREEVINNKTQFLEFKKFLNENPINIVLYMIDSKVDFERYSDFLGNYVTLINSFLTLNSVKYYEISLSLLTFKTDNNILWQMPDEYSTSMFSNSEYSSYSIEDRDKIDIYDKQALIRYYIRSSSKAFIYDRTYQKFTDFLANMTGILSQIILIIYVLMNYLNEKAAVQKVMRKIMKYKDEGNFHVDKILELFKNYEENFIMTNKNINNSNKTVLKNEDHVSKNDIEVELDDVAASEGNAGDYSPSCACRENRIFEVRKIDYGHPSEKLSGSSTNIKQNENKLETQSKIELEMNSITNKKDHNHIKNERLDYLKEKNRKFCPLRKFSTPDKYPKHQRHFSNSSNFYNANISNRNSTQGMLISSNRYSKLDIPKTVRPCLPNVNFDSKNLSASEKSQQKFTTEVITTTQNANFRKNNLFSRKVEFKPLKLTVFEIIKNAICRTKRNKSHLLFSVAERKVMYYMDVLTYVRLLGEIDLLKQVLFNDQQRFLFEFLSKPLLDDNYAKLDENYYTKKSERALIIDFKEIEGLYKCYNKVKSENRKVSDSNTNSHRLLNMIDEEIDLLKTQNI